MADPRTASPADLLVTPDALAAQLRAQADLPSSEPRTRVLDVRWSLAEPNGHRDFLSGHIPGAIYVDLESELSSPGAASLGRHPLPGAEALTHSARRWGLHPADSVVAYDGGGNYASARLWWLLRDAGFRHVRLLDGALPAWIGAGFPLEAGDPAPDPGTVTLAPGQLPTLALEEVGGFAREHLLIDARAPERFRGETEPMDPVAGHIPGARNLPTSRHLDEQGRFLPADVLRAQFAAVGADAQPVGFYCGSGITASHSLFAFALAGGEGTLFPGSWSQWSNHADLPVARGTGAE